VPSPLGGGGLRESPRIEYKNIENKGLASCASLVHQRRKEKERNIPAMKTGDSGFCREREIKLLVQTCPLLRRYSSQSVSDNLHGILA
jgi:hypothetical protein